MKKTIFTILFVFLSININAQSTKKFAISNGYSADGILFSGLYFTQPLNEKLAVSISAAYGIEGSGGLSTIYEPVVPLRLDISYRMLSMPLNVYIGAGADIGYQGGFVSGIGLSYGWKNFAFFTELLTYSQTSRHQEEVFYLNGEYSYINEEWETQRFSPLVFGFRWFFK